MLIIMNIMINATKKRNQSEDIKIDYPGLSNMKQKYDELEQKLSLSFIINLESFESFFKLHFSNIFCFNSLIVASEFISIVSFISLYLLFIFSDFFLNNI